MKRVLTLILASLMLLSSIAGVSADSTGLFKGMDVLSELTQRADTDFVRRDEFAAVAATLMGLGSTGPAVTAFSDVKEDNVYGAAIRTVNEGKIMNGVNAYQFAPESTISFQDAIVTYIRILGYEVWANSKGGYPTGYINVATRLKLFNDISKPFDSMLTFDDLWKLTDWVMEVPTAETSYKVEDGNLTEEIRVNTSNPTLLEKNLGMTMYEATVEEVIAETHSVKVVINDDEKDRTVKYSAGDTIILNAATNVNIIAYDKAPVNIWITDKDELKYISIQNNCEVVYGPVYSVNRDYSSDSKYNTAAIKELTLWDDETEYEISENGAKFYYNEKPYSGSIALNDMYVRMVIKDEEVVAVETWDFKEGGIVSQINFQNIAYKRGDIEEAVTNIENYTKQVLILDGEVRDIKDLKPGTIVDYFVSDNRETVILLGSEKKYSDVFEVVTDEGMQIGNIHVKLADTFYACSDDKGYLKGTMDKVMESNITELIGAKASAYIDAYGRARYVTNAQGIEKKDFIGYLIGAKEGTGLSTKREVYVANIQNANFEKKIYTVSKKVNYEDALNWETLIANRDTASAKSLFVFKLNSDGEIANVSKLNPYHGYKLNPDGLVTATIIKAHAKIPGKGDNVYFDVDNNDGKRIYFPDNFKMTAIYKNGSDVEFGTTTYEDIVAKNFSEDIVLTFFGQEMSSEFDLILVSGGLNTVSGDNNYGVVEAVRTVIGEDGEEKSMAEVDGKQVIFDKNDPQAEGLSANTLILYTNLSGGYTDYDIDVKDAIKLDGKFKDWAGKKSVAETFTLMEGRVAKIDSKRVFFEDGSVYFFGTSGCKYKVYDSNSGKLESGSGQDFMQGRKVIYVLTTAQTVTNIFYER